MCDPALYNIQEPYLTTPNFIRTDVVYQLYAENI